MLSCFLVLLLVCTVVCTAAAPPTPARLDDWLRLSLASPLMSASSATSNTADKGLQLLAAAPRDAAILLLVHARRCASTATCAQLRNQVVALARWYSEHRRGSDECAAHTLFFVVLEVDNVDELAQIVYLSNAEHADWTTVSARVPNANALLAAAPRSHRYNAKVWGASAYGLQKFLDKRTRSTKTALSASQTAVAAAILCVPPLEHAAADPLLWFAAFAGLSMCFASYRVLRSVLPPGALSHALHNPLLWFTLGCACVIASCAGGVFALLRNAPLTAPRSLVIQPDIGGQTWSETLLVAALYCGMLLPLIALHASACSSSRCGAVMLVLAAVAAWYALASAFTVKLHAYQRGAPAISITGL